MNSLAEYSHEELSRRPEEPEGLDLREYLHLLFKFKWGIISVALLAGLTGLYLAYKAVPIYRSTATLQIERDHGPRPSIGNDYRYQIYQVEFYETQYQLLRSWGVAEMAATRLGLLDADHLEGKVEITTEPGLSWRSWLPDFLVIEAPELTPEIRRVNFIQQIQGGVQVDPIKMSELVAISYDSIRPEWAAQQANAVAESYIDFLRDKKVSKISSNQSWYASRQEQARQHLETAEHNLLNFLDRQGLIRTAEGVDALQSQALQLALGRREDARQEKLTLDRLNREIQAAHSSGGLQRITALESRGLVSQFKSDRSEARSKVTQLARRYGPKHPRMLEAQTMLTSAEQAYSDELQTVAEGIEVDFQRAARAEATHTRHLTAAQAEIQSLNRNRAEMTKLQEAVKTSRTLFEQLQAGEKTAGLLEGGIQNVSATVIEYARPGLYPVRPNKQRMVLMWILGGLLLGVGLAFLLNLLDNTFKDSDDVERRLGLPVLGQLAQLKVDKKDPLAPMNHFIDQPRSAFSESIRTIRTSVMLSAMDRECSIIAIVSSVPGEGKTTLAINLAHAICRMKKTLLIDTDMRRPRVHQAKQMVQPRPGLVALVTDEASFAQAHEVQQDGLHVIPSGTVPANPLELLSSQRFKDLLAEFRQTYEMIIIDSAPALAVSDALVVAQLCDALIYVIRADATPFQLAEQGIRRLRRANAPLLGCILNQVISGGRGYYGKYGRYGKYPHFGRYSYYSQDFYHDHYGEEDADQQA